MKKTVLIIGTFGLLMTFQSYLQAQFFEQDFSNPTGWRDYDADGDGNSWGVGTTPYFSSQGNVASSASFDFSGGVPLTPDNYLFSPEIDLSNTTGTLTFSFVAGSAQTTGSNHYEEFISAYLVTDTTMAAMANVIPIHAEALSQGETMISYSYDISSLVGESSVFIVFRHHNCTFEGRLYLDDVVISGTSLTTDVSIICGNDSVMVASIDGTTLPDLTSTVTAESTCSTGNITITQNPVAGSTLINGENTITFYATDGCSNVDSCSIIIALNDDLGIDEMISIPAPTLFPNPAEDVLFIEFIERIESITIYSYDGKIMDSLIVQDQNTSIDISTLKSGLYICEIMTTEGAISSTHFIKK